MILGVLLVLICISFLIIAFERRQIRKLGDKIVAIDDYRTKVLGTKQLLGVPLAPKQIVVASEDLPSA